MIIHNKVIDNTTAIDKFLQNNPTATAVYVATSEIRADGTVYDIYSSNKPGIAQTGVPIDQYFGVSGPAAGTVMTTEEVESLVFHCIADESGNMHYSRSDDDAISVNDETVSGGRFNSSVSGPSVQYKIANGAMVQI